MRKRQIQTQYYRLCQYLCYLYPDLQLCDPYSFLSPGVVGYNESAIGEFLKDQFLACWNHTFQEENPPNGEYLSQDDDTITLIANYSVPLLVSRPGCTGLWLEMKSNRQDTFFSSIIHLPEDSEHPEEVVCVYESDDKVLYWTCPHCSANNSSPVVCTACNSPIPSDQKKGLSRERSVFPGLYYNNYYFVQSADPLQPIVFIRYPIVRSEPTNLIQTDLKSLIEPFFCLYPSYSLSLQYPSEFAYNGLFVSVLLPSSLGAPTSFFHSDILRIVDMGGSPSTLRIVVDPERATSLRVLTRWDDTFGERDSWVVDVIFDPHLFLTMRYVVIEPQLLMVEVFDTVLKIRLKEPVEEAHLSHVSLTNEPNSTEGTGRFGIFDLSVYSVHDKLNWNSIPVTAASFSFIGGHIGPERGVYSIKETRTATPRCSIVLSSKEKANRPWFAFMVTDQELKNSINGFLVSEFIFYNQVSCFNQYVDWNTPNCVQFHREARLGMLYWKSALPLRSFEVEYDVSLSKSSGFVIWWLSNTSLPKYHFFFSIASQLQRCCREDSQESTSVSLPFHTKSSVACVMLYCAKNGERMVRYAYIGSQLNKQYAPSLVIEAPKKLDLSENGSASFHFTTREHSLLLRVNGQTVFSEEDCILPFFMQSFQSYAISGFVGKCAIVSRYEVRSTGKEMPQPSYILVPSTDLTLCDGVLLESKMSFNTTPCSVNYRDHVSYGSLDPALSNPITYEMRGYVFALDPKYLGYGVIARDYNNAGLFYMELHSDHPLHSFVAMNRGVNCTVHRISPRTKSSASCFNSSRLSKFCCNCSGLINYNNTCFQNSALQLLFHSDAFKQSLFHFYCEYTKAGLPSDSDSFRCVQGLVRLLTRLQVSIRASEYNDMILILQKRFALGYQHVIVCGFAKG